MKSKSAINHHKKTIITIAVLTSLTVIGLCNRDTLGILWHYDTYKNISVLNKDDIQLSKVLLHLGNYDCGDFYELFNPKMLRSIELFMQDFDIDPDDPQSYTELPATTNFHCKILTIHPDWKQLRKSQRFRDWVSIQPAIVHHGFATLYPWIVTNAIKDYKALGPL
ncbi:hypothetical protein D1BOALGB6SA_10339 [Olavius sp. associated proteobacterium Delta 1]|nr:hypothetical protein D1BOALGB6SA_10339 [Olavius sp. associated proteobacterium Delta 1]